MTLFDSLYGGSFTNTEKYEMFIDFLYNNPKFLRKDFEDFN